MNFDIFCSDFFEGKDEQAISHLAEEARLQDYSLSNDKDTFDAILNSMTQKQRKQYRAKLRQHRFRTDPLLKFALLMSGFFLLVSIHLYFSGYKTTAARNKLEQTGIPVVITVVDKEYVDSFENSYYNYTFSYEVDGKTYTFVDSPDRDYGLGYQFKEFVDPTQPKKLILASSDLFFSFMLLSFAIGSLFLSGSLRWLLKNLICPIILVWDIAIIITGIALRASGYIIVGSLFLALTLSIWLVFQLKKYWMLQPQ